MLNDSIIPEKEKQFFLSMGLTTTESKVYLTLVKIGPSQVGIISKETEIQRPNLYKIIDSLSTKGLIEKEINSPIKYKATPPQEAINMLIEYKKEQFLKLKNSGKTIAKDLEQQSKTYGIRKFPLSENRFIIIPGKTITINRLRTTLENAQKSLDVVTSKNRFSLGTLAFADSYEDALKRGVKIRVVTEDHQLSNEVCIIIKKLSENSCFKVRFLPPQTSVDAIVSIFDQKETFTTFAISADQKDPSTLWSNNHSFLSVMQSYFESKWEISQPKPLNCILAGLARKIA
jgi:sugar-specific transcriptional regulator TrmB